ncbi:3-isopropylmalate dehydrogenase [Mycena leptocephala]|nr:3-isopropylmalate dehydrogenase [Mycena leptocephala]
MAPRSFRIVVLPGDGIGPEVVAQAVRVLETISAASPDFVLNLEKHDFGGCAIDSTGDPLPPSTLKACEEADAILMGSIGGPKWGVDAKVRPEPGLLKLRKALGLYANIRPANFASDSLVAESPIKLDIAQGVDLIVVERITRVAATIALSADPPLAIHSIDKANVLACSRLGFPQIKLDHQLVDSAAMLIVANPRKLNGVILTENLFGDILSDQSSVIPGSLGLLPSASLAGAPPRSACTSPSTAPHPTSRPGHREPHRHHPQRRHAPSLLPRPEAPAKAIEDAVRKVLDDGMRTADLRGTATTVEVGDRIVEVIKGLL